MSLHEARKALERLRMLAFGNDFANEGEIRRDYELVSETLDLVELLDHDCAAMVVRGNNQSKGNGEAMIHEDDEKALGEIVNVLCEKAGDRPAIRESITRLIGLVYEKGQLRGTQALLEEQVKVLRGERDSLSESNVK